VLSGPTAPGGGHAVSGWQQSHSRARSAAIYHTSQSARGKRVTKRPKPTQREPSYYKVVAFGPTATGGGHAVASWSHRCHNTRRQTHAYVRTSKLTREHPNLLAKEKCTHQRGKPAINRQRRLATTLGNRLSRLIRKVSKALTKDKTLRKYSL